MHLGTFVGDAQHEFSKTHGRRFAIVSGYHKRSISQYHSASGQKRCTHQCYKTMHGGKKSSTIRGCDLKNHSVVRNKKFQAFRYGVGTNWNYQIDYVENVERCNGLIKEGKCRNVRKSYCMYLQSLWF